MIKVHFPAPKELHSRLSVQDTLTLSHWYVTVGEVIQAGNLMLEVQAPIDIGIIDILTPPQVTSPHRVVHLGKEAGERIYEGDFLIALVPVQEENTD